MTKCLTAAPLAVALSANLALAGFVSPALAAECNIAKAPKGLKRRSYVRTVSKGKNKGFKHQYSDRPGWIYILDPKKGWVVTKCFR
jgi:hypothetical protein